MRQAGKALGVLCAMLLVGGCLANGGSRLDASAAARDGSGKNDEKEPEKKQVCDHTSIGGEPKSFCY